jgi:drug/metabolite transporter (DMT)-like permease
VDPEYWAAYRRRARARATFQFFLLLGPLFIVGAVLMLVLPIDPNDVRDSPMIRQVGAVAFVVVGAVLMVASVMWLRAHRRG